MPLHYKYALKLEPAFYYMHKTCLFTTLEKVLDKPGIETDWRGNILSINSAAQQLFQINPSQSEIHHISELLPQSTALLQKIALLPIEEAESLFTLIDDGKAQGKTVRQQPLELKVSVFGTRHNAEARLLFILRLTHSHTHFSKQTIIGRLLSQAKIPVSIIDESGYFVAVNETFEALFGYRAEQVKNQHFTLLLSPLAHRRANELHASFFQTEQEHQSEWEYIAASGELKTVLVTANFWQNPDGQRLQIRTYQDITAHVESERQSQQSEALMHFLFDYADIAIALIDEQGELTHANLAFSSLFGYDQTEIIKYPLTTLFCAEQHSALNECCQKAFEDNSAENREWPICSLRGQHHWIHFSFRRLKLPNKATRVMLTARDVTINRNVREQLAEAKRRAEQAE